MNKTEKCPHCGKYYLDLEYHVQTVHKTEREGMTTWRWIGPNGETGDFSDEQAAQQVVKALGGRLVRLTWLLVEVKPL